MEKFLHRMVLAMNLHLVLCTCNCQNTRIWWQCERVLKLILEFRRLLLIPNKLRLNLVWLQKINASCAIGGVLSVRRRTIKIQAFPIKIKDAKVDFRLNYVLSRGGSGVHSVRMEPHCLLCCNNKGQIWRVFAAKHAKISYPFIFVEIPDHLRGRKAEPQEERHALPSLVESWMALASING